MSPRPALPRTLARAWTWLAAAVVVACGKSAEPGADGVWATERLVRFAPEGAAPRFSAGNVSRPRWDAESGSTHVLVGAAGGWVEFELARASMAEPLGAVALVLTRDGEELAPPLERLDTDRHAGSGWARFRAPLAGVPAGSWELAVRVDGADARAGGGVLSVPRVLQRADGARPNVLFLSVDTLRADHLGCYGHDRPTSPEIDAFAAGAVRFERAISPAPWTLPSYSSLLSGRATESHGVFHTDHRFAASFVSFVELFANAGYATDAVASGTFTDSYWGMDQGFDTYDDLGMVLDDDAEEQRDPTDLTAMEAGAHRRITSPEVADKAIGWLRAHADRRFFLFVQFFDPHGDYRAHEGFSERFPPRVEGEASELMARMHALYEGEVAFTDHHIGRVLAALDELGLAESTLVVLHSDHGEEFEEHGEFGHGTQLYNEQVHVPLILRVPGLAEAAPRAVSEPVAPVDVGPTLLELCRVPGDLEGQGTSLAPLLRSAPAERADFVRSVCFPPYAPEPGKRGRLYAYRIDDGAETVLCFFQGKDRVFGAFDWSADPEERFDVSTERQARCIELHRPFMEELRAWRREWPAVEALQLDPGVQDALGKLGYGDSED